MKERVEERVKERESVKETERVREREKERESLRAFQKHRKGGTKISLLPGLRKLDNDKGMSTKKDDTDRDFTLKPPCN